MALDKALRGGVRIVPYFYRYWSRLTWQQLRVPEPYTEHWTCSHKGRVVGEFFRGKSDMYFGIVYAHHERSHIYTIWRKEKVAVLYSMTAMILGPSH